MQLRWGSLFIGAGFVLLLLLKLDVLRPAEWFMDAPDPAPLQASVELATPEEAPAFLMLTHLTRSGNTGYYSRAGKAVREAGLLSNLIAGLNTSLRLPRTIGILLKPCGEVDAYYDPAASQIVFCDEFFYLEEQLFSPYYTDQASFNEAVLGATTFTLFHEVGHALIDQFSLPVLGREEDAADQIATYLLTASGASDQAFRGGEFFAYLGQDYQPGHSFPYWDEHGLNEQRFYNISCLLYGYDPGRYAFLVSTHLLPLDRASRCPAEAAQSANSVRQLLASHLKE